jgi:7-carboxy-7-deazaguanine synthase
VDNKQKTYPVSEVYGPVCQGEGPLTGRPTIFLRLGGCDYRCSWCDSLYAVEAKYAHTWEKMTIDRIIEIANVSTPDEVPVSHVTISGGNPALHDLTPLVEAFHDYDYDVAIETQGSVFKRWLLSVEHLVVSPKPPSSGNVTQVDEGSAFHRLDRALESAANTPGAVMPDVTAMKIVVFDDLDYLYARSVREQYPTWPMWVQVGTDVGHDRADDLIEKVIALQEKVLYDPVMFNVHVGMQTHVLLHGHKRGI